MQQLPHYVEKNHNNHVNHNGIYINRANNATELQAIVLNTQSDNQYVTPVLDLMVPQHHYPSNSNNYEYRVSFNMFFIYLLF